MKQIRSVLRTSGFVSSIFKAAPALLLAALFGVMTLSAQTITTGDIAGTVKDQTGAIVPGATVELKSLDTGNTRNQQANQSGEYRFTTLPPGNYQISASMTGLKSDVEKTQIAVGQVATFDLTVKPEASQQIVEVTSVAPLLQSENANLATTYDTHQLENLPAPGNDMTSYAFSTPGVTISTGGGYGNFSAFGLPGVSNLFTLNGTDNMDPYLNLNNSGASNLTLGSNEISEAAVVLNGYTGQYGRQAGANVNYVTKSGTNQWHGNAGWWYNDRVLNANDFFNNANGVARPFSISNEWADSIGGPIVKDKLFFFIDNEGLRYVLPAGGPVYIPTPAFSNYVLGNLAATNAAAVPFYQTALGLYAHASGAGQARPVTLNDDPSGAYGCGDFAGGGFGTASTPCAEVFRSTVNNLNTEWLLAARVDYNVGAKDRLFFRYNTDHGVQATGTDPINSAFNANSVQPSYGGQLGWTRTVTATQVNQLLLSGNYYTAIFGPPDLAKALATFPTTFTFSNGLFNNLGGTDYSYPQGRKVRQWQAVDDYSWSLGTHTVKFGGNARKNFVSTYAYGGNTSGTVNFNSMTDFVNGVLSPDTGSNYSQTFARIGAENLTMYSVGFYLQDEWRVRQNLTLTLAARFDRNSNIRCGVGCFNELATQPFGQLVHDPTIPYNQAISTGLKEAFPSIEPIVAEPRVGFAYNPKSNTVIRGGFGIFSDLYQGLIADRLITNAPAVASFSSTGLVALNNPNSIFAAAANSNAIFQNGFNSGATYAQMLALLPNQFSAPNMNTVANKMYNPKYYEWNFEVQQGFGRNYVFSANYVGNKGYQEANQTLFGNAYGAGFQGVSATVPDVRFGQIRELNSDGFSNYNGLVTNLRWRPTSNFTGSISYTWSHALDTCSNACLEPFNALTAPSIRYQLSPLGLRSLNYSSADYDIRHSVNANYVYTLAPSHFSNGFVRALAGGWTVGGTVYWHTGYPFSVVDSAVRANLNNVTGIANQTILAEYLGGFSAGSCTTPNVPCFSASSFAPASSQFNWGNLTRNSFRGPGYFDTDMNLNRTFSLTERFKLLIGMNAFNLFNHPNFDLPFNNVGGNYGSIQSTVSAPTSAYGSFVGSDVSGRVLQTQIKLTF
ncbi:MAG TPA: carboxypeptidase regulatory-like domain-containing protein [Bryobacteraceae bacterium]|jgi:hypothetical protein|nr:carboxypeptidase regulatory-like domain-containing protein [Bryobacteraceae bacterium]